MGPAEFRIIPPLSWFRHCRGIGESRPELSGDPDQALEPGSSAILWSRTHGRVLQHGVFDFSCRGAIVPNFRKVDARNSVREGYVSSPVSKDSFKPTVATAPL